MFRVPSAPIIRSTIKTADAVIGTVHVSVWFKSVERCPRFGSLFHYVMAKLDLMKYRLMMHGTINAKFSLHIPWFESIKIFTKLRTVKIYNVQLCFPVNFHHHQQQHRRRVRFPYRLAQFFSHSVFVVPNISHSNLVYECPQFWRYEALMVTSIAPSLQRYDALQFGRLVQNYMTSYHK
jgi:hypothetical protein